MANNQLKTPFAENLNKLVRQGSTDQLDKLGMALPCSVKSVDGSIVTVNFLVDGITIPEVTCPIFGPEWIRYPVQVGDFGFTVPATAYLGQVSGLGDGTAGTWQPANLSALVFFPIGNKNWTAPTDPDKLELYGPAGVIIRDQMSKTIITLTADGITIELQSGDAVTVTNGDVIADGISLKMHTHDGVTSGSDDTGPPNP